MPASPQRSTPRPSLLLGGTFDPPHYAHLLLAECARAQFDAPTVTFLPAGDPWRKTANPGRTVTPAHHRLAMLRLAIQDNPAFTIDERELRRTGPTYTVDTLRELHAEHGPGHRITLILGTDAIADLPNWREPEAIRQLATIAIAPKPAGLITAPLATPAPPHHSSPITHHSDDIPITTMPPTYISSTLIRTRVRDGLPIRYLTPDPVIDYISRERLYRE